ncbi:MAG: hypothetical protein IPF63_04280 [Bacteroidetes bacterium]|nr:hypothetical protein [Bacteroidota bacterium]
MRKIIFCFVIFIILTGKLMACSWYDPDEEYYNLFDQHLLADKSLTPFLLTYGSQYYGQSYYGDKEVEEIDYNIKEWSNFFDKKIVDADLNYLVYESSNSELSKILATNSFSKAPSELQHAEFLIGKGRESLEYLIFAKKCEQWAILGQNDDWSYNRKKMDKPTFMATAKIGNLLFDKTKDKDLKVRIAYQLVRLSHYAGFNDDAVRYFNTYMEPIGLKNLIYFYALEQKGGALFNQNKFAEAAYTFVKVFENTPDRKISCYNSFRISSDLHFSDALKLCKTNDEKASLYAMRGYQNFSNALKEMENIYAIAPNSNKMELLAIRDINKAERELMELGVNYGEDPKFLIFSPPLKAYMKKMILFSEKVISEKKVKRLDFWNTYLAHLYFLNQQYEQSQNACKSIVTEDKAIKEQAKRTEFSAYLANLKFISSAEESLIFNHFMNKITEDEQQFMYELLGHKYLEQKDYAKAFLCHNEVNSLYPNHDLKIIEALFDFVEKPSKNKLEAKLLGDKLGDEKHALNVLNDLKGTYFLFTEDFIDALIYFRKVPSNFKILDNYTRYNYNTGVDEVIEGFDGFGKISGRIFSAAVRSYFEDTEENALTDLTYKEPQFSFIKEKMNKLQLVETIIKLQELSIQKGEIGAKANYLLANYFFNTTNAGYYRNIPYYEPGNYNIYTYYNISPEPLKEIEKLYNFNGFGYRVTPKYGFETPFKLYILAEELSTNQEFKAKSVFMAAKCEVELFFLKEEDTPYELSYWGKPSKLYSDFNRPMFAKLYSNYSKTKFITEVKTNCSYYRYYLAAKK